MALMPPQVQLQARARQNLLARQNQLLHQAATVNLEAMA